MGRQSSWPILINELKSLSISDLKKYGYLKTGHRSGNFKWKYKGRKNDSIHVNVVLDERKGAGILDIIYWLADGQEIRIPVSLTAIPTNLKNGQRWYFICAYTGKRCSKLHYYNGYFLHRSGIAGSMYGTQTESKNNRLIRCLLDACFAQFEPEYYRCYKGKPTKKGNRLQIKSAGAFGWLRDNLDM